MRMPRSYTQDLAEWVTRRDTSRSRQDTNVVAFLALKPDIQAAITAGYSLVTIWTHLHEMGKIPYRYETFLKTREATLGAEHADTAWVARQLESLRAALAARKG